ncbi:MAG TPA: O-antigen polymerase [Burkholderiaceae bacterium]|nr:O-antigen polymerase [Burkholderiaceae bacterium]HNG77860.1 O-antigen polymerase [Burkholderiaceae bacterium]
MTRAAVPALPRRRLPPRRSTALHRAEPLRSGEAALAPMPWWCAPYGVALGFLIPVMGLIALAGDISSAALTIRGVRFLNLHYVLLGTLMVSGIALGGWVGAQVRLGRGSRAGQVGAEHDPRIWERAAAAVAAIALLGYVVWFKDFLLNPLLLWRTVTGAWSPSRDEIGSTAGVSSLVNVAQVFFAIYAFRLVDGDPRRPPRWMHRLFALMAVLTVFRVYVWSERLALIEMLTPLGLALGRWMAVQRGLRWRWILRLGPYAALPVVLLYFGAAEYARSWSSATYQGKLSFWEFALGRFVSYYYTSLNNGAGLVATTPEATWHFEHVMEWAHRAPFGVGRAFSEHVGFNADAKSSFLWFLRTYEDVEFNSNSGLFTPIADLGVPGALVYMLLLGLVSGLAFRAYRAGRLGGVLLFPLFFISFFEIFRYPFLGQPRAFTWTLGIVLAVALVMVQRLRAQAAAAARPRGRPGGRPGGRRVGPTSPTTRAAAARGDQQEP